MRWIRSPLLHFLVIGGLLFAVHQTHGARGMTDDSIRPRIEIDAARIDRVLQDFVVRMGRRPEPEETNRLLSNLIDEEILYHEALARGLRDRDSGVQTRLIQKMLFLEGATKTEDVGVLLERARALELYKDDIVVRRILIEKMRLYASTLEARERPTTLEIQERYAEIREDLREPDRLDFVHLFLSSDLRRTEARRDAWTLRSEIERDGIRPEAATARGDPFPLGTRFSGRSEEDIGRSFGTPFGRSVTALETGQWSNPIASAYGFHLVWVELREAGEIPPLEAVANRIRHELERERQQAKLSALLNDLKKRYEITLMDAAKEIG